MGMVRTLSRPTGDYALPELRRRQVRPEAGYPVQHPCDCRALRRGRQPLAAAHLTVFQRTANYSVPARNAPLAPEFRQHIKDYAEGIRAITRETLNGMG